jgi:hypothetical protein
MPTCASTPSFAAILPLVQDALNAQIGLPATPGTSRLALDVVVSPPPKAPLAPALMSTTVDGPPLVGRALTCVVHGLVGVPTATVAYDWSRDGIAVAGAHGRTLTLGKHDAGHRLACTATASNASGPSASRSSSERSIPARCVVPAVAGLTLADATTRLQRAGCAVATHVVHVGGRKGRVVRSRPAKGRRLANGARVVLDVRR